MNSEDDTDSMPFPWINDTIENTEHDAKPSASAAAAESGTSESGTSVSAAAAQAQPATRPYKYKYGAESTIDDEVTAMILATEQDIRHSIELQEFPTRHRQKRDQTLSERAVPFPRARVEKIMKAEAILCAEAERRRRSNCSQARRPCKNRGERQCSDEAGSCDGRHPPVPAKLAGECGLLMGKAAELLTRELAVRSHAIASRQGKATMQRRHVLEAAAGEDMFDFLVDVLPRPSAAVEEEASGMIDNNERNSVSVSGPTQAQRQTNANGPITVAQAAAQLDFLRQLVLMQQQPPPTQPMQPPQPQQNGQDGQDVTYI